MQTTGERVVVMLVHESEESPFTVSTDLATVYRMLIQIVSIDLALKSESDRKEDYTVSIIDAG